MSGMYDRLKFAAQGMLGGAAGAPGLYALGDERANGATSSIPRNCCSTHPGHAWRRRCPVAAATATLRARSVGCPGRCAERLRLDRCGRRDYGVVVLSTQRPEEQITLPRHLSIDVEATRSLRSARNPSAEQPV